MLFAHSIPLAIRHEHRDPACPWGALGTKSHWTGKTAETVGGDEPDGVGPAGQKRASQLVSDKAHRVSELVETRAGLWFEMTASVEGFGHGSWSDACSACDIADRDVPRNGFTHGRSP